MQRSLLNHHPLNLVCAARACVCCTIREDVQGNGLGKGVGE